MDRSRKWQPIILPQRCSGCFTRTKCGGSPGKIGENEGIYEYVIKYKRRLSEVKDYENIIIKSTGNGNFLTKDVAKVELYAFNYGTKNTRVKRVL
jgi:HAE1 family hydrophobic/amphiphilic exporter-1